MDSSRNLSGNVIGDNAAIFQGNFNYNTDSSNLESTFLEKISRTDPLYDKRRILELKGPLLRESSSWILNHDDFSKWRYSKESGVFWIKGDPGKGKTMLLCGIIEDLESSSGINFGYFFCQATDSRINTAQAVVGGLVRFFLERRTKLLELICKKFKDKLDQLSGANAWEVLRDIFETVVQDSTLPDPICIVDALDECEHGCKSLLSLIVKTSPRVKWLVSSRNIKDIERKLQSIDPSQRLSLELGGNAFYVSQSVDAYINKSIQDIEALANNTSLQASTANVLKSKANGTYLWVSLVVGQLQHADQRNVKNILDTMPEGLESLYDLIMTQSYERLGQKDREAYLIILSTITIAKRPLQLEELFPFTKFQWQYSENINSTRDIQDMVKDCGAILSIRDNYVYFIHQSAKDYIIYNASKWIFPLGFEFQHARMAHTSLYMLSATLTYDIYNLKAPGTEINGVSPPCPDPLAPIAYCCEFWVEHLVHSCESNKPVELFKENGIIHSFLGKKFLCWLEALALLRKLTPQGVEAVYKLRRLVGSMANSYHGSETSCLRAFMNDAHQFLLRSKHSVRDWPLQLYYSAVVFDNEDSIIYKTFQQIIHAKFPNLPTIINRPKSVLAVQQVMGSHRSNEVPYLLCYSPDSTLLGSLSWTSGSPCFSLWRTDSGTLEQVIEMESDGDCETECPQDDLDYYVAFTPDSKHLVSVSSTGLVQRWIVASGCQIQRGSLPLKACVYTFKHYCEYEDIDYTFLQERVVALSQNGDLVASTHRTSSSGVSSIKIWSTNTGNCLWEIEQSVDVYEHEFYVMTLVFSPNSALLAFIDGYNIRIFSTQTGEEVRHLDEGFMMYLDYGTPSAPKAKFSPDSRILACVNHEEIQVFEIEEWTQTWHHVPYSIDQESIIDFDISPDSAFCISVSESRLFIYSISNKEFVLQIPTAEHLVAFAPQWSTSSFLLASSSPADVRLWSVDTSNMNNLVCGRSSAIMSPNSKLIACQYTEANDVRIFNADSGNCVQVLRKGDSGDVSFCPIFSPNSKILACGECDTGDIRVWRISTGECIHISKGTPRYSNNAVFSPDSKIIAYIHDNYNGPGYVCVWHISTGKFSRLLDCQGAISAVFSDDSKLLFLGQIDGLNVWVYCMESDQCVYSFRREDKGIQHIRGMAISPGSKFIALVFEPTHEAQIWDWHANHCISSFVYKPCPASLRINTVEIAFSSDSTVLAIICGVPDGEVSGRYHVQIRDVATSLCLALMAVGESDSWKFSHPKPSFDVVEGCITTSCGTFFRKKSSWEHYDKALQPRYYLRCHGGLVGSDWIYLGREKICLIPDEFHPLDSPFLTISGSLFKYTSHLSQIIIIRFPGGGREEED